MGITSTILLADYHLNMKLETILGLLLLFTVGYTICYVDGEKYYYRDTFKQGCNYCRCEDEGEVVCGQRDCSNIPSCEYDNSTYYYGDRIDVDCNTCFCRHDGWDCTERACFCEYNNETYAVGDRFKDECNDCYCSSSGDVRCQSRVCSDLPTCEYNNSTYYYGEQFEVDCNRYYCLYSGEVRALTYSSALASTTTLPTPLTRSSLTSATSADAT